MNWSFDNISLSNLYIGDFNALAFSLTGMSVIFSGLVIISLYIVVLPTILRLLEGKKAAVQIPEEEQGQDIFAEKELLLAIATALHLDQNFPEENQKITWKSHGDVDSPWQMSGKVHGLSQWNQSGRHEAFHR